MICAWYSPPYLQPTLSYLLDCLPHLSLIYSLLFNTISRTVASYSQRKSTRKSVEWQRDSRQHTYTSCTSPLWCRPLACSSFFSSDPWNQIQSSPSEERKKERGWERETMREKKGVVRNERYWNKEKTYCVAFTVKRIIKQNRTSSCSGVFGTPISPLSISFNSISFSFALCFSIILSLTTLLRYLDTSTSISAFPLARSFSSEAKGFLRVGGEKESGTLNEDEKGLPLLSASASSSFFPWEVSPF